MAPGRNEPCPCGSGKKFKRCCGIEKPLDAMAPSHLKLVEKGMALLQSGQIDEAERCFRQALSFRAGDPGLLNLLGVVELHRHRFDEAARLIQRAIAGNDREPQFYNHLAHALKGQGKRSEAAKALERAVALDPDCVEAHHNLGNLYEEMDADEKAVAAYRSALALRPNDVETLHELGVLLLKCDLNLEAEAVFRRLLVISPYDSTAHGGLGDALKEQGLLAEAGRVFERALHLPDVHDDSVRRYGQFLIQMGRIGEAEVLFSTAIRERKESKKFYFGLCSCRKFTREDHALLAKIESLALAEQVQTEEFMNVFYALGKAYDDLGEYEKAFLYYEKVNQWYGGRYRFDRNRFRQMADSLIEFFSGEFLSQPGWRSDSDTPIFIVGMPRSGTTLTEQIISSHPLVHGAGELTYWSNALLSLDGNYKDCLTEERMQRMGDDYLRELETHAQGCAHVTDKMPGNYLSLGLINRIFPKAKIVHCRRNPVDTCLSIYFQNFSGRHEYRFNLGDLAFVYRQYRRLMEHWRSVLPPHMLLEIQYEDMVENQEEMSRKLIEFCGLEWDDRCLEFFKTERRVKTASLWQVRQPIYKTSRERWRNYEPWIKPLMELLEGE